MSIIKGENCKEYCGIFDIETIISPDLVQRSSCECFICKVRSEPTAQ